MKSLFPILDSLTNNILNFSNRAASFKAGVQSLLQRLLRIFLVGLLHFIHLPLGNSPGLLCVSLFERRPTLWLKSGMFELALKKNTKKLYLTDLTKSLRTMSAFGQIFTAADAKTRVLPLSSLTWKYKMLIVDVILMGITYFKSLHKCNIP